MKEDKIKITKVLKIIVLIIIVAVFIFYISKNVLNLVKQPTNSFILSNGDLYLEESVEGYIIRDEVVIQGENYENGMLKIKNEGERVAKGDSIFRYYSSGEEQIKEEIAISAEYLPKQLSIEEVETIVKEVISEVGATSMKDMGKVMKSAKEKIGPASDGKTINEVVKKLLS